MEIRYVGEIRVFRSLRRGIGPVIDIKLEDLSETQHEVAETIIKEVNKLKSGLPPLYYCTIIVGERGSGKSQAVLTALINSGIAPNDAEALMREGRVRLDELVKYKDLKSRGARNAAYNALKEAAKISPIPGLVVIDDVERLPQGYSLAYGLLFNVIYQRALKNELDVYPIIAIDKLAWEYSLEQVGSENKEIIATLRDRAAVFEIYWQPEELIKVAKKWFNESELPPEDVLLNIAKLIKTPRTLIDLLYRRKITSFDEFIHLMRQGATNLWNAFVRKAYSPGGVLSRGSARAVWPEDVEKIIKDEKLFIKTLNGNLVVDDIRMMYGRSRKERERPGRSLNTACKYKILEKSKDKYGFTSLFLILSLKAATDPLSASGGAEELEEIIRRTKRVRAAKI